MAEELSKLLSKTERTKPAAKTILYCLNPRDNEVLGHHGRATSVAKDAGQDAVRFPAGGFNDQKDGMERQMTCSWRNGLLSRFVAC